MRTANSIYWQYSLTSFAIEKTVDTKKKKFNEFHSITWMCRLPWHRSLFYSVSIKNKRKKETQISGKFVWWKKDAELFLRRHRVRFLLHFADIRSTCCIWRNYTLNRVIIPIANVKIKKREAISSSFTIRRKLSDDQWVESLCRSLGVDENN